MKKAAAALMIALMTLPACSYAGMASHEGKLYVARNGPLFGLLRTIYECTADGNGNMVCTAVEGKP